MIPLYMYRRRSRRYAPTASNRQSYTETLLGLATAMLCYAYGTEISPGPPRILNDTLPA